MVGGLLMLIQPVHLQNFNNVLNVYDDRYLGQEPEVNYYYPGMRNNIIFQKHHFNSLYESAQTR